MVFTRNKAIAFKAAYGEAIAASLSEFTFEGHEFDVSYARYLIQYLETNFKSRAS